ncbi:MAG: adenine phosphoribosyltransferase [Longispora sp.]|nr:adenine phosphoribosyltransferase [Longispora sp. (in: high G+C Gram-positive bacteria)]
MSTAVGDSGPRVAQLVASRVVDVPDFPTPGIVFKDLIQLFSDGPAFRTVIDEIVAFHGAESFDLVVGIEARGFTLAAAVAYATGKGMVLVRKAGKLPRASLSGSYDLEYGSAVLELQADGITPETRVLILDDVLATGGTLAATADLVERAGGQVIGTSVLLELGFLKGRQRLTQRPVHALLRV